MKLTMKFLHEVGSYGLAGGFGAQLVVLARPELGGERPLDLVEAISAWMVFPCLVVVIVSGITAMVLRPSFVQKGWLWLKIFLSVPALYAALGTYPGVGLVVGDRTAPLLQVALLFSIFVTVLSVYRPKGVLRRDMH